MKKILSLLLALALCLSLCACGGSEAPETTTQPGTPLTLENYDNYLTVFCESNHIDKDDHPSFSVQSKNGGLGMKVSNGYTYYLYQMLRTYVFVEGASTNFNYFDVEVTVKFSGTYQPGDPYTGEWKEAQPFEHIVTVKCNIAGKGVEQQYTELGDYFHDDMMDIQWEIIDVAGYVDKA